MADLCSPVTFVLSILCRRCVRQRCTATIDSGTVYYFVSYPAPNLSAPKFVDAEDSLLSTPDADASIDFGADLQYKAAPQRAAHAVLPVLQFLPPAFRHFFNNASSYI